MICKKSKKHTQPFAPYQAKIKKCFSNLTLWKLQAEKLPICFWKNGVKSIWVNKSNLRRRLSNIKEKISTES